MATPFETVESKQSAAGVLLRRGSITLEGIENLLAQAKSVREVTATMISKICDERRVDLRARLARGRKQLYRRYLKHCFEDMVLSEEERADLAHLRSLLHLSAADLAAVHDDVAIEVYGEAVQEVLEDFRLDEKEEAFLRGLREELGLAEETAKRIYHEGNNKAQIRAFRHAESRDQQFIEHRTAAGEFAGRSQQTLEDAIQDALAKAVLAVPSLHWFEVTEMAGYVGEGKTESWHVMVRAGIRKEES